MEPPVTAFIGIGQRAAGDAATDPQVKQLGLVCAQAQLDVAQALAAGKLGERQAQELVQARKAFDVTLPAVLGDQSSKRVKRQMLHKLGEDEETLRHDGFPKWKGASGGRRQDGIGARERLIES